MPLIAEAAHGTFFGIMGQRGPTSGELQALQDACAGDMRMMRHCRQCRSDAVGMLGEDLGAEFTLEKVAAMDIDYADAMQRRAEVRATIEANRGAQRRHGGEARVSIATLEARPRETRPVLMAVATSGGGVINQHFGQAREFLIYQVSATAVLCIGHRRVDRSCGEGETVLQHRVRTLDGCEAVLCSTFGIESWGALEAAGIQPIAEHAFVPIEDAVAAVYRELAQRGLLSGPLHDGALQATA
jgi:nitrogen fixation protein NifB